MSGPVIVCGVGNVGRRVVECLVADNVPVVAIDHEAKAGLPGKIRFFVGDCRERSVLQDAGVENARGVIICTSDDLINLACVLAIRGLAPQIRVVVRSFNPDLIPRLGRAVGNVTALSVSALAAPLLALIAQSGSALGTVGTPPDTLSIVELEVTDDSPILDRPLRELNADVLPIAWSRGDENQLLSDVPKDIPLAKGDRVIICGKPEAIEKLTVVDQGILDVRWAGWSRRGWRVLSRAWHEIDWPVKVCSVALLIVVLGSALVYHWVNRDSPAEALYHTVSVLATGADLHAEKFTPGMKVFVSGLRLAGAALLACFTAILTNYLVHARLGRALEVRRIPDEGHVVVCGLGNVGFRIVESLRKANQAVVVVEPVRDGRFLVSARRLGAATIVGDATAADVLQQARVTTARAVVATTSSDLVNVEIALLVRELAPRKRVVLRLSDIDLAKALREAANVQFAISVAALAAPAFVAALYGDRVQSVFLVGGKLLVAVELTVTADDQGLNGKLVTELGKKMGLLAVALKPQDGHAASLADHRLAVGDRLTVVATLSDLDRLYRRERAVTSSPR
ncbi:MAG: potassium channel family protein [Gemmataceae bacterium]